MDPKRNLTAQTVSENLALFMQRYALTRKDVAKVINMPYQTFLHRMKMNDWHILEVRCLNERVTLKRGLRL